MDNRPNILLITTDQQRADSLGCYGNSVIETPHLNQLAAEGVQFNRAYVNNPVCSPSRASMITGRYPHVHGITINGTPLRSDERTLAHLLSEAGYRTASLGKSHLGPTAAQNTEKYIESKKMNEQGKAFFRHWQGPYRGFEYVQLSMGHGFGGNKGHYRLWLEEHYPEALKHFDNPKAYALEEPSGAPFGSLKWGIPPEAHSSTWTKEMTCDYLENHQKTGGEEPFFAWVNFQDPHSPFACPAPYRDQYDPQEVPLPVEKPEDWRSLPPYYEAKYRGRIDEFPLHEERFSFPGGGNEVDFSKITEKQTRELIAHYYGMVSFIDDQVGEILGRLKELDMEKDTIVIFTSDHGELLGDHGLWLKGPFHYEGLIRVPMIWRYPEKIENGMDSEALMSHVDIAPTLFEWAEVEIYEGVQGIPQTEVLEGKADKIRQRALCEFRVSPDPKGINAKTLVTERYKITYYAGYDFGEMYDLENDPKELNNLWHVSSFQKKKNELLQELLMMLVQTEDPLPLKISQY